MKNNISIEEQTDLNEKFLKSVTLGDEDKVLELLNDGANMNATNVNGDNAIFIAADRRKINVFDILLEYQDKDGLKINLDNQNHLGDTATMHLIKGNNYTRYIERLIEAGANPNIVNNDKISPLIRASGDQKPDIVEILLSAPNINVNYTVPDTLTTAFLMATTHGDFESAELLFKAEANVNAIDKQGKNALINALFKNISYYTKKEKKKHLDLCMSLIQLCNIDYVADSGATAFWIASVTKQKEACLLMMEKGVNVDVSHELGLDGKMSALHIWCQIGDEEMVEKIISQGGKLGVKDSNNNTPEAYAFMRPKLRSIMLKHNIDPNTIYYTKDTKLPIFSIVVAAGDKQIELVKDMIDKGVKVTYENEPDMLKSEPIVTAVASSAKKITNELLKTKKINVNKIYKFSESNPGISLIGLLFNGTMNGGLSATLEQKKYYENLLKAKEINEKNGIASDLISKEDFEKIKQEVEQINKLEENIEIYRLDIFRDLIANNALLNLENESGLTEIFFANKPEYINLLADHGSNIFHENKEGQDLLYYSIINGKTNNISYLKEEFSKVNHKTIKNLFYQLAFEGVNNYIKQKHIEQGIYSFIDYANNPDIKKVFSGKLEEGETMPQINIPQVNYQDEDGNSPLIVACANGNGYLINPFLKMGAQINLKNYNGETALMHALTTESGDLVKYLIEKGANINESNNNGVSIWQMAEELNNKTILNILKIAFDKENEKSNIPKP